MLLILGNEDGTYNLIKEEVETYISSLTQPAGFEFVSGSLYKDPTVGSQSEHFLTHVCSILKVGQLYQGDKVQVGFYGRSRQKPYIKRLLSRNMKAEVLPIIPPTEDPVIGALWSESEGGVWKANKGLFLCYQGQGLGASPEIYPQAWDWMVTFPKVQMWPHPLVASNNFIYCLQSFYDSFNYTKLQLKLYTHNNTEISTYFATQGDKDLNTRSNFPKVLIEDELPLDISIWKDCLRPTNSIFLNGDKLTVIERSVFNQYEGPLTFNVWQIHYDIETEILQVTLTNLPSLEGKDTKYFGGGHVSVAGSKMLHYHLTSQDYKLYSLDLNSNWQLQKSENPAIPALVSGWTFPSTYIRRPDRGSNAPAFFSTKFIFPFIAYRYNNFTNSTDPHISKLWNIIVDANGDSSSQLVAQEGPTLGTITNITSVIDTYASVNEAYFSSLYVEDMDNIYGSYTLLEQSPGGYVVFGPLEQVNCSSPCWQFSFEVTGVPSPYNCAYEECETYWGNFYEYVKGTAYYKISWGGVSTGQVFDYNNDPAPSLPPEYVYSGMVLPLPAGRPNLNSVYIDRHRWGCLFTDLVEDTSKMPSLDPQIVFDSSGIHFQCILRPKPIRLPWYVSLITLVNQTTGFENYPQENDLVARSYLEER